MGNKGMVNTNEISKLTKDVIARADVHRLVAISKLTLRLLRGVYPATGGARNDKCRKIYCVCIGYLLVTVCLFFRGVVWAGPPPGTAGYTESANTSGGAVSAQGGLKIDVGIYSPGLTTLQKDLPGLGWTPLTSGLYLSGTFLMNPTKFGASGGIGFDYWSGSASKGLETLNLGIYSFYVSPHWNIQIMPEKLMLGLGLTFRDVLVVFSYSESVASYYNAWSMMLDLGPKAEIEFYPLPDSRALSISASIGYVLLGLTILPLEVMDSTIPVFDVGTAITTSDGVTPMNIETNGLILKVGISFHFSGLASGESAGGKK